MFAGVWMVGLPISFVSPNSGVLLWIWVALLSPNELLYGIMAGVPFNKLVAFVTFGAVVFSQEKKDFYLDAMMTLLIMLGLVATVSWLGAIVPSDDGENLYEKLIKVLVLAFLITGVTNTRLRIHLLVLSVVTSLAFLGVKEGLIALLTAGGHHIVGTGSIGDNNSLATALLMIIPLTFYLARYSALRIIRVGMMVVLGLSVVTVVMTYSRGGFLGLVVLAAFMVKNSRNKAASLIMVAVGAVLVYSLAPASWFDRLGTIETAADNDSSFLGRVVAWKMSWLVAQAHPFFGGGPHAIQRFPVWSAFAPYVSSLDFFPTPPPDVFPHAAHSIYFEVLGDLGFTGLFLFLLIMLVAFWQLFQIKRMAKGRESLRWAVDLASMLQVTMVVYMVTAALLSMAYFEMVYVLLALISRCRRTVKQSLLVAEDDEAAVATHVRHGRFVPGPLARPSIAARGEVT